MPYGEGVGADRNRGKGEQPFVIFQRNVEDYGYEHFSAYDEKKRQERGLQKALLDLKAVLSFEQAQNVVFAAFKRAFFCRIVSLQRLGRQGIAFFAHGLDYLLFVFRLAFYRNRARVLVGFSKAGAGK